MLEARRRARRSWWTAAGAALNSWLRDPLPDQFLLHAARFGVTGVASAGVQLGLLTLLVGSGLHSWLGNGVAIAVGAQVNFALSQWFTWRDRLSTGSLGSRWVRFSCAISSTVALNFGVFAAASLFLDPLLAAACGIAAAAVANFFLADRFVFVRPGIGIHSLSAGPQPVPVEES